jgi:hypothetical protein
MTTQDTRAGPVHQRVKPLASESRKAMFACPEGGHAVIEFPSPLTVETLDMLAELTALMFRGMRRDAETRDAQERADAEYRSWFAA